MHEVELSSVLEMFYSRSCRVKIIIEGDSPNHEAISEMLSIRQPFKVSYPLFIKQVDYKERLMDEGRMTQAVIEFQMGINKITDV